jgi:hypothetical protein
MEKALEENPHTVFAPTLKLKTLVCSFILDIFSGYLNRDRC